jgi:hypothetical protein
MVMLLIGSALIGCSVATDTPTSAPATGSYNAGPGSFPRSFLIPGTDTSIRVGGS